MLILAIATKAHICSATLMQSSPCSIGILLISTISCLQYSSSWIRVSCSADACLSSLMILGLRWTLLFSNCLLFFVIPAIFLFWFSKSFDMYSWLSFSPAILNLSASVFLKSSLYIIYWPIRSIQPSMNSLHWWFNNFQALHDIFQCWLCHCVFRVFKFWITKEAMCLIYNLLL